MESPSPEEQVRIGVSHGGTKYNVVALVTKVPGSLIAQTRKGSKGDTLRESRNERAECIAAIKLHQRLHTSQTAVSWRLASSLALNTRCMSTTPQTNTYLL